MKVKLMLLKRLKSKNTFCLKLTHEGSQTYKAVDVSFSEKEWNYNTQKGKRKNELRVIAPTNPKYNQYRANLKEIDKIIKPYQDAINDLIAEHGNEFSFDSVFKVVGQGGKKEVSKTVFGLFEMKIAELEKNEQYGTASSNKDTAKKLKKFLKKDILLRELDEDRIKEFKKWMEVGDTTKRIYLRNIRAIFGYAIKHKVVDTHPYVSGDIFNGLEKRSRKIALTFSQVNELRQIKKNLEVGSELWIATSYFIFGYLGRGINFQDIARLKWDNINEGRVYYVRKKTRGKSGNELSFPIIPELKEIISYYRGIQPLHSTYIFNILDESHIKEKSKLYRIKKILKVVNRQLKQVGEEMDLPFNLTSYVWRHSFASVGKNTLRLSAEEMREYLDHKDIKTTEGYLANFDTEQKDKALIGL